ncbi:type I-F CRISPR-associated helicase Cas3f [Yersinia pekkanenii]|uniref:CRISPR-associated helicase Cas3 family protein n=1 Tax=Yersinia pekkanenii TaxID=1288385 RepID=A0A0T9Q6S7_9GAMM|nr:type I-F CRISPR-associated helicase Cas3f [Yersinia pekkanenii]CNH98589.1 CRISPR-associated helicase Cas3 family protein [Yersinia pekkanenii]CRY65106.1 CRISPR-associated helicase Cas3 family protein [Yersinia pekkanenii]
MNILLISQCNKRALVETRRILDQFAERKGDRTWQTAMTLEGLNTLRKLLRKTARRNSAVACHWIKNNNQSELLWIIGNLRRFNAQGTVPTNTTQRDILRTQDENSWHSVETIALLAGIAGLFHDFGKANLLFQKGLRGKGKTYQPYRHEWVSLRLFQAFVAQKNDNQWLTALSQITADDEMALMALLVKDGLVPYNNPFITLPPLATTIAWLIISHHRMPVYPTAKGYERPPKVEEVDDWLYQQFMPVWNSTNMDSDNWSEQDKQDMWQFPHGTPIQSTEWRKKAQKFAKRALQQSALANYGHLTQRFTSHMARLVLMLADHHYSSLPAETGWQDEHYRVFANTDRKTGEMKQRLDEHNIGVGQNALLLGRSLPHIGKSLPAITRHKGFKQRATQERFRWQDKAFDLASSLRERSQQQGFFGINMASTGCGKTFANARIMYGLADEKQGCRFSIALGLRTLTLQTGDALRQKLSLQDDDLAVLIGSQAVSQLHQLNNDKVEPRGTGSQSADAFFAEHQYVSYDGSLDDGRLSAWLGHSDKLNRLLSAPVLVCTIDHLIPATESLRGGKQIAPMLRLLTSDLVLDEPDDFDLNDLPALCRLVNWAGMLGSRVLLSSATLPPSLVQALFSAYGKGRADYQQACGQPHAPVNICCAWFDENDVAQQDIQQPKDFIAQHNAFVTQRVTKLATANALRKAELIPIHAVSTKKETVLDTMATVIRDSMLRLHQSHHQIHPDAKTVSLGVVRMANIDPLVAIAQRLYAAAAPENYRIHYCVYHSQHPLAVRSAIERRLDATLTRYQPDALWQVAEIKHALQHYPEQHHLFVVLATSVAEVGRDHDYDWALAEPSSMRSLIQLAGRVQRHRQIVPQVANLHILQKNFKALSNTNPNNPAYLRPGFESSDCLLNSHDLNKVLLPFQYKVINAISRIQERGQLEPHENFVDLEHVRLKSVLQGNKKETLKYYAALWWRKQATWSGEQQRRTPFRQSVPDEQHNLWIADEADKPVFKRLDSDQIQWKASDGFQAVELRLAAGNNAWIDTDYLGVYQQLAESLNKELNEVSQQFGEIRLSATKEGGEMWRYHPLLGVFGALD